MATFNTPAFDIAASPDNVLGPITSPSAVNQATFDFDFAALVPLQPLSPAMQWQFQITLDSGVTWNNIQQFDVVSLGLKRDGTQNTRLSMTVASSPPFAAGARFRCLVDSPVAVHSAGGTL